MTEPIAQLSELRVSFGQTLAIDSLDLTIGPQARIGLIGESGSGKSLTAAAILGLLPRAATATGSVQVCGEEMLNAPESRLRQLRGKKVGLVAQDPRTALNPLVPVGLQVAEPLRSQGWRRSTAIARAVELLDQVHLPTPDQTARRYPGQLSGGQRQRVGIAMALAAQPALLIADEPTSALDVTVQAGVLKLFAEATTDSALLFITHDIAVAALLCQRLVVLQRGVKVAEGSTANLVADPPHPYVEQLLEASRSTALPASCASLQRLSAGVS